ncbi:MAG TPA: histidine kinase dimerization/phospho-acceptor domain-containing protein, partial [Thermoanaerobaculia bacterium]|nr:histidine kinase dimerization/phospho-acceptor domain-containing protein [Thermoanaerobaculia bacterium]
MNRLEKQQESSSGELTAEELKKFFSVLSHDLKSPIFSIDGFSDLLLSDYQDRLDEEGVDFLRRIRSSVQQMKRVLEEMSHMLKLLGRPSETAEVDLSEVVDEVRLRHNFIIEETGVDFQVSSELPV